MKREKSQRQKKIQELIRQLASDFIAGETNTTSLITITSVDISPNLASCDIFVTVFPEESTDSALNFLKRKRPDLKKYIKSKMFIRKIPFFDFKIDQGELNRQAIDKISAGMK